MAATLFYRSIDFSSQWWCVSPARRCGSNLASAIAVLLYRFTAGRL